ncbi:MAG: DEAD/DEAH box helicase, partial [Candidatus Cryptobacteroides sp.]
ITKLREAACCVSLVEKGMCGSSKLAVMTDKLLQILEQGNRVLVFSQFTSFLDLACKELEASGVKEYYYLNGSTPLKEREKMVEAFQRGDKKVFFISLKAGGLGLNLTGANYVIHLDPWWNPAIESQATDRAYRIGQKEKVTVYHLISEHTIEEKILRLHQSKRSLADSLLDGTSLSGKLSVKELLEMIEG